MLLQPWPPHNSAGNNCVETYRSKENITSWHIRQSSLCSVITWSYACFVIWIIDYKNKKSILKLLFHRHWSRQAATLLKISRLEMFSPLSYARFPFPAGSLLLAGTLSSKCSCYGWTKIKFDNIPSVKPSDYSETN